MALRPLPVGHTWRWLTVAVTEPLRFVGAAGAELAGVLHRPDGAAHGSVLLAHCFTCSKDLHTMTRLSRTLTDGGYVVLRFDFTGLGSSEGDFVATTVSTNVGDLSRAALTLIELGVGPCALVGHSLGGAAALLAAQRLKTVRSVVALAAPSTPDHVRHLLGPVEERIESEGEATVTIAGRSFTVAEAFLADLGRHDQEASVGELGRPLLVVHPTADTVVPITEGERIFAAARQPKGFLPVPGADHLLSRPADAEWVGQMVVSWLDRTR